MHTSISSKSDTHRQITVTLDSSDLTPIKDRVVRRMGKRVKLAGFRDGKAPLPLVEKSLDQSMLQTEVIEEAVNQSYVSAIDEHKLRPVVRPEVSITKFVPFTTLEYTAEVEVVGDIKLPDYTKIKKPKKPVKVAAKDIDEVLQNLKTRMAEHKDVDRAAKNTDQVWIDFEGRDEKGEPVKGADGKDYPLVLGSDTFIPGFEKNLIGAKTGEEREFTLTFPKDYGVKALANRAVTFKVTVTKVQETIEAAVDDTFAQKVGPFKTLEELKADIEKQVQYERQQAADRDYEQELIQEIAAKSTVSIPQSLVDEQVERSVRELKQNLAYRGQTYDEFLASEGKTDEAYRKEVLAPQAAERVKAGLVLSEIAEREKLTVTPEEFEIRIQLLKGQYQDAAMQAELNKPENRREIASRLLTEKTINKVVSYADADKKA